MPKFHGLRNCVTCGIPCTPMNYVDYQGKRYCIACWTEKTNPDHPDLEEMRQKVKDAVEVWKCAKWTREEGPLPQGPLSVRTE